MFLDLFFSELQSHPIIFILMLIQLFQATHCTAP